jgi:hypothetical protein
MSFGCPLKVAPSTCSNWTFGEAMPHGSGSVAQAPARVAGHAPTRLSASPWPLIPAHVCRMSVAHLPGILVVTAAMTPVTAAEGQHHATCHHER